MSLSVTNFAASVAELGLNVSCVRCSGPRIHELGALLSTLKGSMAVTAFANGAFRFATKLIDGNFLQLVTNRALHDANAQCPHSSVYDPNFKRSTYESFGKSESKQSVTFLLALLIVGAILLVAVLAVALSTKMIVRRRHRKWVASLPSRQVQMLWKEQRKQDDKDTLLDKSTVSMFLSDSIPFWLRWAMPVIILGNIGFFLSGHLSLGASITILASLGGQTFREENFFEFSVAKSTITIWNGMCLEMKGTLDARSHLTHFFHCSQLVARSWRF